MLVIAKKNPKQEESLRRILNDGFTYNGIHYSRFGKSASQGKDGITAFVCDEIFDELYLITQILKLMSVLFLSMKLRDVCHSVHVLLLKIICLIL